MSGIIILIQQFVIVIMAHIIINHKDTINHILSNIDRIKEEK